VVVELHHIAARPTRQYSYFCTGQESKMSTKKNDVVVEVHKIAVHPTELVSICTFVPVNQVNFAPNKTRHTRRATRARRHRRHLLVSICTFVQSKASKLSTKEHT
jgi:hypothetical protein